MQLMYAGLVQGWTAHAEVWSVRIDVCVTVRAAQGLLARCSSRVITAPVLQDCSNSLKLQAHLCRTRSQRTAPRPRT